jgi:hypothetical protein
LQAVWFMVSFFLVLVLLYQITISFSTPSYTGVGFDR